MAEKKKQRGKPAAPANETKQQRFVRLANMRVGKAIKAISALGNLTGPNYEFTEAQATKILSALSGALSEVKSRFERKPVEKQAFTL